MKQIQEISTVEDSPAARDWMLALEVCGLLSLAVLAALMHGSRCILLLIVLVSLALKRCRPEWPSTRTEVLSVWRFATPLLYGVSLFVPVALTSYGVSWKGLDLARFAWEESLARLRTGVRNRGLSLAGPSGSDLLQFCAFSILPQMLGLCVIAVAVYALLRPGRQSPVPPVITGAAACVMCLLAAKMAFSGDRLFIGWTLYFLSFYVMFVAHPIHRAVIFLAINLTALLIVLPSGPNIDY